MRCVLVSFQKYILKANSRMDNDPDDLLSSAPKQHPVSPSSNTSVSSPYPHSSLPFSSSSSSSSSSLANQQPFLVEEDLWGEQTIREIFSTIQPTLVSEQRRTSIINHVRRLIKCYCGTESELGDFTRAALTLLKSRSSLGLKIFSVRGLYNMKSTSVSLLWSLKSSSCSLLVNRIHDIYVVFPFGSVPLKTYLPDGDIDLTAIDHKNMEEDLGKVLCSIIKDEQQDPEFMIQDVQYIPAQVKVVKCIIGNVPVDISFNQMAGLSALCFLEKVDQLVGKDHLFKRSIALTKAWCYYESRILGAHHGLISTYALETLVLCIINQFHSSLCGPLAVLHRFLEYFSTFDWDNFCVTINGPVALSSLQVNPEYDWKGRLLTQNFLSHCRETLSVPLQALETTCNDFPVKHMNIVDPLKNTNNLGRSVSKGNLYRIRCALSYGFQRLDEILELPSERMNMQLEEFFAGTLDRNGRGQRSDVLGPVPIFSGPSHALCDLSGDYNCYYSWLLYGLQYHNNRPYIPNQNTFVLSQSQSPMESSWNSVPKSLCRKQSMIYHRAPKLLPATSGSDDWRKARGTGTFIPNRTAMYRERSMPPPDSSHSDKSDSDKSDSDKSDSDYMVGTDSYCFDLSLEQFPLLPSRQMPITSNESDQPTIPPKLDLRSLPTADAREKQGSTEIEGERSLIAHYQLKDGDEFPPLLALKKLHGMSSSRASQ